LGATDLHSWVEFGAEQQQHGQTAQVFGVDGYIWPSAQATMENWQSEFLQLLSMVVLTSFLIHRGSAESKDSNDRMEQALQRIEQELQALKAAQPPHGIAPLPPRSLIPKKPTDALNGR